MDREDDDDDNIESDCQKDKVIEAEELIIEEEEKD